MVSYGGDDSRGFIGQPLLDLSRLRLFQVCQQLHGQPHARAGVGRVAVGPYHLTLLLRHRRAANHNLHLIPQARFLEGFDIFLEHRHRRRQKRAHAN